MLQLILVHYILLLISSCSVKIKKWKLNKPITVFPISKVPLIITFDEADKNIQNVKLVELATVTFTGSLDV